MLSKRITFGSRHYSKDSRTCKRVKMLAHIRQIKMAAAGGVPLPAPRPEKVQKKMAEAQSVGLEEPDCLRR